MLKSSLLVILLLSCSPAQQKSAETAKVNVCKARSVFKLAEEVNPSLKPMALSARDKLETAEDELCKSLPDAG